MQFLNGNKPVVTLFSSLSSLWFGDLQSLDDAYNRQMPSALKRTDWWIWEFMTHTLYVLCRGASFLTFVISQTCQLKFPLSVLWVARGAESSWTFWISQTCWLMGCERIARQRTDGCRDLVQVWRVSMPTNDINWHLFKSPICFIIAFNACN